MNDAINFSWETAFPTAPTLEMQLWKLTIGRSGRNSKTIRNQDNRIVKPREKNSKNQLVAASFMYFSGHLFQGLIWFEGEPLVQMWQSKYLKTNVLCSDNQYQLHEYTPGYHLVKNNFFKFWQFNCPSQAHIKLSGKKDCQRFFKKWGGWKRTSKWLFIKVSMDMWVL